MKVSILLPSKLEEERRGRKGEAEWEMFSALMLKDSHSAPYLWLTLEYRIRKGRTLGPDLVKARPQFRWNLDSLLCFLPSLLISSYSPRLHGLV